MDGITTIPAQASTPHTDSQPYHIEYTEEQVDLIKRTVARGATDDELKLFVHWCRSSGFDPLRKQAHFQIIKSKCQDCKGAGCARCDKGYVRVPTFIAGIDGLLSRANEFPDYGGITGYAVHEKDDFEFDALSGLPVKHHFNSGERGKLVGAWARVNFKGGKSPLVIWYPASEYSKVSGFVASQLPDVMIVKAAMSIAIRRSYPSQFSGVYSPEEFGGTVNQHGELLMPSSGNKAFLPKPDNASEVAPHAAEGAKRASEYTEGVLTYRDTPNGREVQIAGKWGYHVVNTKTKEKTWVAYIAQNQISQDIADSLYKLFPDKNSNPNKHEADNHAKKNFKGVMGIKLLDYEQAAAVYEWKKNGRPDPRWYGDKIATTQNPPVAKVAESIEARLAATGLTGSSQSLMVQWAKDFKLPQPYTQNAQVLSILEDVVKAVEQGLYDPNKEDDRQVLTQTFLEAWTQAQANAQ